MQENQIQSEQTDDKATFGFWVYLMTDLVIFAGLFATYAVLKTSTFGGPAAGDLFDMPHALVETLILLTSSFTCGLAMLFAHQGNLKRVIAWFSVTFLLGGGFLTMELNEFSGFIAKGNTAQSSAFLSAFFTLVGTHGLHIAVGLLWIVIMIIALAIRGLTPSNIRKLTALSMFWHFLDLVWIFIFTFVYLLAKS